jgi:hypothetical protein
VSQGCRYSAADCFDDDSCTIDTCDAAGGCQHTPNNCTKSVDEQVGAGGSATTDTTGDGATPLDPVQSTVTTPNPGPVNINIVPTTTPPPTGFGFLDLQIQITAPPATATAPIRLTFQIDASTLPAWFDLGALAVYRNGAPIEDCSGPNGVASPDPCVASRSRLTGGGVQVVVLTSSTARFNALASSDTFNFGIPSCISPVEVQGLRMLPDKRTLAWDLGADATATYEVTRGALSELPVGNGVSEACIALDATNGSVTDDGVPDVAGSFWYLVRARNACGAGNYGTASNGSARSCSQCP